MTVADQELLDLQDRVRVLEQIELIEARDSLAIYAGLHIPAEIERDDLPALHKLPIAARYIPAEHHQLLIEKLEAVERGEIKRLMVFMPQRAGKSIYCSTMFPAWYLGRHPTQHIIQGSYNYDLAARFGKMARKAFASKIHRDVFGVGLAKDSQAAGDWQTEQGGEYYAFGMNAGISGHPANGAILDDLIAGRRDAESKLKRDNAWDTYEADIWGRLERAIDTHREGWIIYVATRWHPDDPAGRILPDGALGKSGWFTSRQGEKWYVLCLVAEVETPEEAENDPLGRKIGERLWPEWFSAERFQVARKNRRNWNSLYQQKPRPDEGSVIKRDWWRKWPHEKLPANIEYIMSVYDTAFEVGEEDDYSARTSWGVFEYEEPLTGDTPLLAPKQRGTRMCAILLDAWQDRVDFPTLRKLAQDHYFRNPLKWKADAVLIEKKASGHSLIQELQRAGVPVRGIKAVESKLLRAHAASEVFQDGCVFYPDRRWAEDVVERCAAASFIKGDPGNDMADTVVHAMNRMRSTYRLQLRDEQDEDDEDRERTPRRLYG